MQHLHMTIKFYLSLPSVQDVCWYVEFWYMLIAKTALEQLKSVYWPWLTSCCASILILHHDPFSSRCYSSQSVSQPAAPTARPGKRTTSNQTAPDEPRASAPLTERIITPAGDLQPGVPERWTFTCLQHHTIFGILRRVNTQRWLCWRTEAGTNTQNLNWV